MIKEITILFERLKRVSRRKKLLLLGIVICVVYGIVQVASPDRSASLLWTVKKEDLVDSVLTSGNVVPASRTDVYSPSTGIIENLFVQNGEYVEEGAPLFSVKSSATERERAQAAANYQSAISSQKAAEQNKQSFDAQMWSKRQALLDAQNALNFQRDNKTNPSTGKDYTDLERKSLENAIVQTEKDFSFAERKYKEADIALSAAYAQTQVALLGLNATENTEVKAPIAGTVVNLSRAVGESVVANTVPLLTPTSAVQVLTITTIDPLRIQVRINEGDITRIQQGQIAQIEFDGIAKKIYQGVVDSVDALGTNSQGIITYNAYLSLNNGDDAIRPQMTANVRIETLRKSNVLTVPNSALIQRDGKNYVVLEDDKREIAVQTGIRGITKTEIIDGVAENVVIISDAGVTQ